MVMFHTEALEMVYMKDEAGAVYQVVPFHDKLLVSVNSEVGLNHPSNPPSSYLLSLFSHFSLLPLDSPCPLSAFPLSLTYSTLTQLYICMYMHLCVKMLICSTISVCTMYLYTCVFKYTHMADAQFRSVCITPQVRLYKWEEGELAPECSYTNTILALFLKCMGDFILVSTCTSYIWSALLIFIYM